MQVEAPPPPPTSLHTPQRRALAVGGLEAGLGMVKKSRSEHMCKSYWSLRTPEVPIRRQPNEPSLCFQA